MSFHPSGVATISYIECLVKGYGWNKIESGLPYEHAIWRLYKVWKEDDAEVWIVRPDGLRRAWSFKLNAIVEVGQSVVQFRQEYVKEELAVDEDAQSGKSARSKVV